MKKGAITTLLLAAATQLTAQEAQRNCGTELLKQHIIAEQPWAAAQMRTNLQNFVDNAKAANNANMKTTAQSAIPVVFHIILTDAQITKLGGAASIATRIDSQMAVINRDFNAQNNDSTKIPAGFKALYGNTNIQFALAHRAPDGSATPGYEIITTTEAGFEESSNSGFGFAAAKQTNGFPNAWDATKYLNIWVINPLQNGVQSSILGLTMPPSFKKYGVSDDQLGIILNYGAFGARKNLNDYYISGINGGRTLTHELGHYFEVWHVWGDDNGLCPNNGGADDGISDTPPQADATYGNPSGTKLDGCTATGNGIMYMNYMDYVNDAYMHMFSKEQASVMHSMVTSGNESYSLTQNPELLLYPTSIAGINGTAAALSIYPNPTTGIVNITYSAGNPVTAIQVTDITGRIISNVGITQTTQQYTVDMSMLTKGMYLVQCSGNAGTTVKKILVQ